MRIPKALGIFFGISLIMFVAGGVYLAYDGRERAVVTYSDVKLRVRLADNPVERTRGLSGYALTDLDAEGMLFVFPAAKVQTFWMKDMHFPLDVVWIQDHQIVAIDYNLPAPARGEEPARMSSEPLEVDKVLELPAGRAKDLGLQPGAILKLEY